MEYNVELVHRLMEPGEMLNVNGVMVECKPVPDGDGRPAMDPRALRRELAREEHKAKEKGPAPTLDEMRSHMGGFNYNLCRQEIWTRYIEVPTSYGKVPVWGYYPRQGLVYVHGGAFFGGSPFTTENSCRLIADRADAIVWNVDYSLAPEHPYPIPCTQINEVVRYLHDHGAEFGMDPDRIAVAGDSAGGNLCASAALMDRDQGTYYVKAQILLYAKLTFFNHLLPGYSRDESVLPSWTRKSICCPGCFTSAPTVPMRGTRRCMSRANTMFGHLTSVLLLRIVWIFLKPCSSLPNMMGCGWRENSMPENCRTPV